MRGRKGKEEGDRVRCMRYMYMCGVEKEDRGRERAMKVMKEDKKEKGEGGGGGIIQIHHAT